MDELEDATAARNTRYRMVEQSAMRRAELRVIGCDYGATAVATGSTGRIWPAVDPVPQRTHDEAERHRTGGRWRAERRRANRPP